MSRSSVSCRTIVVLVCGALASTAEQSPGQVPEGTALPEEAACQARLYTGFEGYTRTWLGQRPATAASGKALAQCHSL